MSSSRAINAENKVQYINRKRRIRDKAISKRCLWMSVKTAEMIGDLETCTQASNVIWTQAAQAYAIMLWRGKAKVRTVYFHSF